jgi:ribonuclease D
MAFFLCLKVVGLDCEFTDPRKDNQRATILELSVAQHSLVFHIVDADEVPQLLIDFLADKKIKLYGASIHNDVDMLQTYGISIPSTINLQQILQNPVPRKQTPSLIDLANHYIGTDLEQKKKFNYKKNKPSKTAKELEEEALIFGWGDFPLSHKQLQYAALDARLGFELGRRHFRALGYNNHMDRLGLNIYE